MSTKNTLVVISDFTRHMTGRRVDRAQNVVRKIIFFFVCAIGRKTKETMFHISIVKMTASVNLTTAFKYIMVICIIGIIILIAYQHLSMPCPAKKPHKKCGSEKNDCNFICEHSPSKYFCAPESEWSSNIRDVAAPYRLADEADISNTNEDTITIRKSRGVPDCRKRELKSLRTLRSCLEAPESFEEPNPVVRKNIARSLGKPIFFSTDADTQTNLLSHRYK